MTLKICKPFLFVFLLIIGSFLTLEAQEEMPLQDEAAQLLLATSNETYPVTPGDIYRLTYMTGGEIISNEILIESDHTLNLTVFGKFDASGKTFSQLKPIIEQKISNAYPQAMPSLTITSVGRFQVVITGEVPRTRYVMAWGLSRLSEVTRGVMGPYSSLREVGVESRNGEIQKYDLFKAIMLGETENDPFIKPGDRIIIYRRGKEVDLQGEINRPGSYQIKEQENLREVITLYAKGFTSRADLSRIKLERLSSREMESQYVDLTAGGELELMEGDRITIPPKGDNRPILFLEGAINPSIPQEGEPLPEPPEGENYYRSAVNFTAGETLYDVLQRIKPLLLPYGDMGGAYIIKDNQEEHLFVNIEKLLYSYNPELDMLLEPYDKLVIPVKQTLVAVMGAVTTPGTYRYIPGMDYRYYVELAGGLITGGYEDNIITYMDKRGNRKTTDQPAMAEDKIIVTQGLVTVTGAVQIPGSYPYTFGKSYQYYLNLAGGVDDSRNYDNKVTVRDNRGEEKPREDIIDQGDSIYVHSNSFTYNFNRNMPVITSSLALITSIVTMINLLR